MPAHRIGMTRASRAAALYVVPLAVLKSLIIGEYTNAAGQALALPALLGAIVWVGRGMPRRWRPAVLLALALAALVHSGVLISLGLWGACWFAILLLRRRWDAADQGQLAGLAYYSAWIGDPRLASTNPECPLLRPVATKLGGVALDLLTLDGRLPVCSDQSSETCETTRAPCQAASGRASAGRRRQDAASPPAPISQNQTGTRPSRVSRSRATPPSLVATGRSSGHSGLVEASRGSPIQAL